MKILVSVAFFLWMPVAFLFSQNNYTDIMHRKLYFDAGKADVRHYEQIVLREIVDSIRLSAAAGYRIELVGHTDTTGDIAYNQTLSEKRSASVARFLHERGVEKTEIEENGFGANAPITESVSETGKQLNRRVEVFVIWQSLNASAVIASKGLTPKAEFVSATESKNVATEKLTLESFLDKMKSNDVSETFSVKVNRAQNFSIKTHNNKVIVFAPETFDVADNTEIKITVKEVEKPVDIFSLDMNTQTTDGRIIFSGGMLCIDATTPNGEKIVPSKNYTLLLPNRLLAMMSLNEAAVPENETTTLEKFTAINNPDRKILWQNVPSSTKIFASSNRLAVIQKKKIILGSLLKRLTDTSGCYKMLVFRKVTAREEIRKGNKIRVSDTSIVYADHAPDGYTLVGANELDETISPLCYDIAETVDAVKLPVTKDLQKKYRRIQRKEFWDVYKIFDAFVFADELQGQGLFAKSARKKIGSYDTLIAHLNTRIGALNKEEIESLPITEAYIKRMDDLRNSPTISKNIDTTEAYSIFETKQTGRMSFGYLLPNDNKTTVDMMTNIPEKDLNTHAKLIFKKSKVVVAAVIKDQFLYFNGIPRGEEVVIAAYKIKDGVSYVALQDWVSDDDIVLLDFQPMSPQVLKQKLKLIE